MTTGAKVALASLGAFVIAVGVELLYLHHRQVADNNAAAAALASRQAPVGPVNQDDNVFLRKERPDSLQDERALIGTTVWVSAGDQMAYYKDSGNHVDYAHPVGYLLGAQPLLIKGVFEQVAPKTGPAVARISAGARHVLLAFTMPGSADPAQLYAAPVGHYINGAYEFVSDDIFFYDDPHTLYKYWGPAVWAHIDKHEVAPGMSENQCMLALGETITPHGDTIGNRSVTYDNDGHPITVTFVNDKATEIRPGE
jgi:hypothetical protein